MKQIIALLLLFTSMQLYAQQTFIAKGKIEFEKKENLYKNIETLSWWSDDDEGAGGENSFIEQMKKTMPQFKLTYFDLYFDEAKSLYKPGRESPQTQNIPMSFQSPANENVVYTDLANHLLTSQKSVYGSTVVVQDSARQIEWRISNDKRTIAGFECRKAVGRIMDSVYVIAFYTDQIVTTAGPESFSGLPGMILGIAIPRINTTWFATKIEVAPVAAVNLTPPSRGKKMTAAEFKKLVNDSMKNWGKFGKRNMVMIMI